MNIKEFYKRNKITPEQKRKWREVYKQLFAYDWPVSPEIFDFLLSQNVTNKHVKLKKDKDPLYRIYSFIVNNYKLKQKGFYTTKKNFKAIKTLFGHIPIFYVKNKNLKFITDKNTLYVGDGRVQFKPNSDRVKLIQYMFGNKINPPWSPLELAEVLDYTETSDDKKLYQYIYGKIKMLNADIHNQVGLENLIITNKSNFTVNPIYSHFLPN